MKQKRKEESISDVIARLIGMKKEFTDYEQIFGRWKDLPSEYLEIMEAAGRDLRRALNPEGWEGEKRQGIEDWVMAPNVEQIEGDRIRR